MLERTAHGFAASPVSPHGGRRFVAGGFDAEDSQCKRICQQTQNHERHERKRKTRNLTGLIS